MHKSFAICLASFLLLPSLAACSTQALSTVVSATSDASSVDREAQGLGTEICIQNDSSMQLRIQWRGFTNPTEIPPASLQCNSGFERTATLLGDMVGKLSYLPREGSGTWLHLLVAGDNPAVGWPFGAVWIKSNGGRYGICTEFNVGQTESFEIDWLHADLTRLEDTDQDKEFLLTVTDGTGNLNTPDVSRCTGQWRDPDE